jgi:hypothetical protein
VDRRAKVELFEQIRREYEHGGGTIRGIAKKLGIHRRMVREAVLSAVPIERKTPVRERPKLQPAMAFVDAILEADHKAPRKQRHTAHRIWCRICTEMPEVEVAESTIRRHVRERKIKLGLTRRETFIPQSYSWGVLQAFAHAMLLRGQQHDRTVCSWELSWLQISPSSARRDF